MSGSRALELLDPAAFRQALHALYSELDAAVAAAGPVCRLSGRCCRFEEYEHTLFVSGLEAAVLLSEAPAPVRPLDQGQTCPWQNAQGHCTARDARPLGCRVYYCEPSYQDRASALSEEFLGRLKRLADAEEIPWQYAPLHQHLEAAKEAGRWPPSDTEAPSKQPMERDFGLTLLHTTQ